MLNRRRNSKRRRQSHPALPAVEICEHRTLLSAAGFMTGGAAGLRPQARQDASQLATENAGGGQQQRGRVMGPQQQLLATQRPAQPPQNAGPQILIPVEVRSLDGTGNNLTDAELGSTDEALLRVADDDYSDGISVPAGFDRPSAREISNAVADHGDEAVPNDRDLSSFLYVWGQFLDHDIDLTHTQGDGGEFFPIAVPEGDEFFDPFNTGTQIIPLTRSIFDDSTGDSVDNPRQQTNQITTWIDGSMIYGSDADTLAELREFEGGRMLIGEDGLLPKDDSGSYMAGDVRANENVLLTSMHTLFVREHNFWADQIAAANPDLSDEDVFQAARSRVIAEIQAITYNEFLPALLGRDAIARYAGYDATVDPSIANEFSTAAFRFGHTSINETVGFLGNDGLPVRDEVELREAFFNPSLLAETGIDGGLKFAASTTAEEIDLQVVDSLRNFLFGAPGSGGFDLVSLNIQRGRDHGLADYNSVREAYGLARVTSFEEITSDTELAATLAELYGSVDNIDVWVGGLAEDHAAGSSVGELFQTIIADQFARLRDGDRFWYQDVYSGGELRSIERTTLADVLQRNTELTNLQRDVFRMTASVSGNVFADLNGNGRMNRRDRGLEGIEIQLLDDQGELVATTTTNARGRYRFDDINSTGRYQLRIGGDAADRTTTSDTIDVLISRGDQDLRGLNFGLQSPMRRRR